MSKIPIHILSNQIRAAEEMVRKGSVYRHNASGTAYEVVGHAVQEATQKVQVLYRRAFHSDEGRDLKAETLVWARDFDLFTDPERFTRVISRRVWMEA